MALWTSQQTTESVENGITSRNEQCKYAILCGYFKPDYNK